MVCSVHDFFLKLHPADLYIDSRVRKPHKGLYQTPLSIQALTFFNVWKFLIVFL
jgi:hypothetical protein